MSLWSGETLNSATGIAFWLTIEVGQWAAFELPVGDNRFHYSEPGRNLCQVGTFRCVRLIEVAAGKQDFDIEHRREHIPWRTGHRGDSGISRRIYKAP